MTARKPPQDEVKAIAREYGLDAYQLLADYEERAAIREFLGGYPRAEAERLALEDVRQMAQDRRNAQKGGIR